MLQYWSNSIPIVLYCQAPEMEHDLPSNIIGKQVARLRSQLDRSQEQLAAKCQRVGLDISRGTLAKIEAGVRCVSDGEAFLLALALGVGVADLFPKGKRR